MQFLFFREFHKVLFWVLFLFKFIFIVSLLFLFHIYLLTIFMMTICSLQNISNPDDFEVRRIVGLLYRQFSNASSRTIVTLNLHLSCEAASGICLSCLIWSPHLAKDINVLEKIQRFACRVALGTWDLSSDQLLIRTGLPTLISCQEAVSTTMLPFQNCPRLFCFS